MLSILCVRLTIKVKAGIPESFKVGWYPPKKTGSSHLNEAMEHFFSVYIASANPEGGLGKFEAVMQTRDVVEGLCNFREFSQPRSV